MVAILFTVSSTTPAVSWLTAGSLLVGILDVVLAPRPPVDTCHQEYLDFVAGISTCALGHADPDLAAAVSNQMKKFHHVSNLYYIPEQVSTQGVDRVFAGC